MYNSDMFARTKRHEEEARDLAFFKRWQSTIATTLLERTSFNKNSE